MQSISDTLQPGVSEQPEQQYGLLTPIDAARAGRMDLWEVLWMALDSLMANKVRSILTMLGVIIGVASVVALLSLGNGASAAITGQVEALGTNTLTIVPGSPNRGPGQGGAAQTLTREDADAIVALNLPVSGVAPQFNSSAQVIAAAADTNTSVAGVTADYQVVQGLKLAQGSFIDSLQDKSSALVAVMGAQVATKLFGSGQAVGQTIRIKGQTLRVIGVLQMQGGSGFGSVDDRILVPLSTAQRRLFGARAPTGRGYRVSSIAVAAINSDDLDAIESRISILLRERHDLSADGRNDDFSFFNQASMLSTLSNITNLITIFLAAVAGISLLVGGIGIMNIMLVSVTERTREIGLRKAVGARRHDILLQFLVESLMLSLLGGLTGLMFGSIIPIVVTMLGLFNAPVPFSAAVLAVSFSLAVGLFFGIYPAYQAARLNPIEALRHE